MDRPSVVRHSKRWSQIGIAEQRSQRHVVKRRCKGDEERSMKIPNAAVLQRTNPHKRDWRLTFWPFLIALAALLVTPLAAHAQDDTPARVARIANFGGQLLLAPDDRANEWEPIGL